jgi:hypothetical protein
MLLEDDILYEIKKENFKRIKLNEASILCKQLAHSEKRMIKEGYNRTTINNFCRKLIVEAEVQFKKRLINEEVFSDFMYGALGHIAPGIQDYMKLKMIRWLFDKLGINTSSKLAGFFMNALKNVQFTELFSYFKEGKCPLIVSSIVGTVSDSMIEYTVEELGKASIDKEPGALEDSSYIEMAGRKLLDAGMPSGFLDMFSGVAEELGGSGIMLNIVEDNIKRYLLPPLTKEISKLVCKDLDYAEISKIIDQVNKPITDELKEKELQSNPNREQNL